MTDPRTAPAPATPQSPPHTRPWPAGTAIHQIVYAADAVGTRRLIGELPAPLNRRAVALPTGTADRADFELLSVPADGTEDPDLVAQARQWSSPGGEPAQLITFQSAQLIWGLGRAAVVAPAERLPGLETVLAELAYYDAELREVERQLGLFWTDLEADGGCAFVLDQRAARHTGRMARRFRELLVLRTRLTRVLPYVLTPHVYPPTLASQVSERLRERGRMRHRIEVLQEQLEVFERIYDACGQRTSDHAAARKGHLLEMVIVVILGAQTLLTLFDVLTRARK
jgi:hypothetical protein